MTDELRRRIAISPREEIHLLDGFITPKNKGGRPRKRFDREKLFQLRAEGKSVRAIAKKMKLPRSTVQDALHS